MKPILLALLVFCTISTHAGDIYNDTSSYSKAWECGWEAGWRQVRGSFSLAPLSPLPPLPPIGQDDWKSGFAAGVLAGATAAEGHR